MFLLVPGYPGSPGQKAVKRVCVCVCVCVNRYVGVWQTAGTGGTELTQANGKLRTGLF